MNLKHSKDGLILQISIKRLTTGESFFVQLCANLTRIYCGSKRLKHVSVETDTPTFYLYDFKFINYFSSTCTFCYKVLYHTSTWLYQLITLTIFSNWIVVFNATFNIISVISLQLHFFFFLQIFIFFFVSRNIYTEINLINQNYSVAEFFQF